MAEGAPAGTPVGVDVGTFLNGGVGITYSLTDSAGGRFAIDPNSGSVTVASGGAALNVMTVPTYRITVQAADAAGQAVSAVFSIAVADRAPGTPVDADPTPNSVAEHAANGTTVGITASASDLNAVTYSLTNSAGGLFAIDPKSGVVTVANGSQLSYAASPIETINVQATDGDGQTSSASFLINVTSMASGSLVIDGISLTNAVVNGSSVSGTANLPLAGSVTLTGTVQGGQYDLTTSAPLEHQGLRDRPEQGDLHADEHQPHAGRLGDAAAVRHRQPVRDDRGAVRFRPGYYLDSARSPACR